MTLGVLGPYRRHGIGAAARSSSSTSPLVAGAAPVSLSPCLGAAPLPLCAAAAGSQLLSVILDHAQRTADIGQVFLHVGP